MKMSVFADERDVPNSFKADSSSVLLDLQALRGSNKLWRKTCYV